MSTPNANKAMKLTGKCYDKFEEYKEGQENEFYKHTLFYSLPDAMIWGVLVDFFISVGIVVDIQPVLDYDEKNYTDVLCYCPIITKLNGQSFSLNEFKDLNEARIASITKANEIYNTL